MSALAHLDLSQPLFTGAIHSCFCPDSLEIYKKRYSVVPSCTAVISYSNTCMAHDVVNTDVFCIRCTPNMNVPGSQCTRPVYPGIALHTAWRQQQISRDFMTSAPNLNIYIYIYISTHVCVCRRTC